MLFLDEHVLPAEQRKPTTPLTITTTNCASKMNIDCLSEDNSSGGKSEEPQQNSPKLQPNVIGEDGASEDSSSDTDGNSSTSPSESQLAAAWDNQFSSTKQFYCMDQGRTCSLADREPDVCQQLIRKEAAAAPASGEECCGGDDPTPHSSSSSSTSTNQVVNEGKTELCPVISNAQIREWGVQQEEEPIVQAKAQLVDETPISFKKSVPLDASDSWDFSLQALVPNFRGKHMWIEGPFYQQLLGECLHEMHHVACECDQRKKSSVCRLCHAVFCSNQCFKKANKVQTGQQDEGEPSTSNKHQEECTTKKAQRKAHTLKRDPKWDNECGAQGRRESREAGAADKPSFLKQNKPLYQNGRTSNEGALTHTETTLNKKETGYAGGGATCPLRPGFQHNPGLVRAGPSQKFSTPLPPVSINRAFRPNTPNNFGEKMEATSFGVPSAAQERGSGGKAASAPFGNPDEDRNKGWPTKEAERNGMRGHNNCVVEQENSGPCPNSTFGGYNNKYASIRSAATYTPKTRPIMLVTGNNSERDNGNHTNNNSGGCTYLANGLELGPGGVPIGIPFPVKYIRGKGFDDFSVMPLDSEASFGALHRSLQTWRQKKRMQVCQVSRPCMLQYNVSNDVHNPSKEWYRGVITKVVNGHVVAYLIDLGVECGVGWEDVYEIPAEFCAEWPHGIRVRCLNVRRAATDDPEVSDHFDALVRKSIVKIRITHHDKTQSFGFGVHLDVEYMDKWFDAGALLKKLQVADEVSLGEIRADEENQLIRPLPNRGKPPTRPLLLHLSQQIIQATLVFVDSLNVFYISTQEVSLDADKVRGMLSGMRLGPVQPVASVGQLSRLLFAIREGDPDGGTWKRVKVLEVATDPATNVVVQKMDTGEIVRVPLGALHHLPAELHLVPGCVYKCSLPVKLCSKNRERAALFERATSLLKQATGDQLMLKVLSVEEQSNTHLVDLFSPSFPDGCTRHFLNNGWLELSHNQTSSSS